MLFNKKIAILSSFAFLFVMPPLPTMPPVPTLPPFQFNNTPPQQTSPAVITQTPVQQFKFPTAIPLPTAQPTTVVSTPIPTNVVSPTSAPSTSTNTVKDFIMSEINKYRATYKLSAVKTDSYTCNFAKIRAKEISTSFNHNGFSSRANSKTLPYPSYRYVNENIAMTSDYKNVVNMWINSPGHAANMRADTPYVCVEQYGNYFAYEGWKP